MCPQGLRLGHNTVPVPNFTHGPTIQKAIHPSQGVCDQFSPELRANHVTDGPRWQLVQGRTFVLPGSPKQAPARRFQVHSPTEQLLVDQEVSRKFLPFPPLPTPPQRDQLCLDGKICFLFFFFSLFAILIQSSHQPPFCHPEVITFPQFNFLIVTPELITLN